MAIELSCGQCQGQFLAEVPGIVVACPHCGVHLQTPSAEHWPLEALPHPPAVVVPTPFVPAPFDPAPSFPAVADWLSTPPAAPSSPLNDWLSTPTVPSELVAVAVSEPEAAAEVEVAIPVAVISNATETVATVEPVSDSVAPPGSEPASTSSPRDGAAPIVEAVPVEPAPVASLVAEPVVAETAPAVPAAMATASTDTGSTATAATGGVPQNSLSINARGEAVPQFAPPPVAAEAAASEAAESSEFSDGIFNSPTSATPADNTPADNRTAAATIEPGPAATGGADASTQFWSAPHPPADNPFSQSGSIESQSAPPPPPWSMPAQHLPPSGFDAPTIADNQAAMAATPTQQTEFYQHPAHQSSVLPQAPQSTASAFGIPAATAPDYGPKPVSPFLFKMLVSYASAMTLAALYLLYMLRTTPPPSNLESLPDIPPLPANTTKFHLGPEMIANHILKLGESRRFGSVLVTALRVTKEPIEFVFFDPTNKQSRDPTLPVLKLYLRFENVSADQEFVPLDEHLVFHRLPDKKGRIRANNFVCKTEDKGTVSKLILMYEHYVGGSWLLKNENLGIPLKPGATLDTYLATGDEGIDALSGDCSWRVHFRKGYNPKSHNGVTTLIEVAFNMAEVEDRTKLVTSPTATPPAATPQPAPTTTLPGAIPVAPPSATAAPAKA